MITLRVLGDEDEEISFQVYASTRSAELEFVDWSATQKQDFLRMQFNAQKQHYLAFYPAASYHTILDDGVAVGRLIAQRTDEEIFLLDLALLPAYRNAGIGAHLIESLQSEACATGKPLRLHVSSTNRALSFYNRLGFRPIAESGLHWEMEWRPPVAEEGCE